MFRSATLLYLKVNRIYQNMKWLADLPKYFFLSVLALLHVSWDCECDTLYTTTQEREVLWTALWIQVRILLTPFTFAHCASETWGDVLCLTTRSLWSKTHIVFPVSGSWHTGCVSFHQRSCVRWRRCLRCWRRDWPLVDPCISNANNCVGENFPQRVWCKQTFKDTGFHTENKKFCNLKSNILWLSHPISCKTAALVPVMNSPCNFQSSTVDWQGKKIVCNCKWSPNAQHKKKYRNNPCNSRSPTSDWQGKEIDCNFAI